MLGLLNIFGFQPVFIVCFLVCDAFAGRWIPLGEAFSSEQKAEVLVVQEVVQNRASMAPHRIEVVPKNTPGTRKIH